MTVRVVTASTSDITQALAREGGSTVTPLNMHLGAGQVRGGVDSQPEQFFRRLAGSTQPPKT